MAELTEREKKIVMIKFIMHGPQFQSLPVDTRENMLIAALKIMGIEYKQDEMLDLGNAVISCQQEFIDKGMGWLDKNKIDVRKALEHSGEFFKKG